ncbi:VanZ family protein [Pseudonocardia sp. WMMC193]|uniref:VanZ family protein n=1 Tax=Pseudonocardia sp. WMMC193 TaxID=2911965 RepID=UPI001F45258F|nr:VanZ family protein [Pseudonocardia sp. WMMC193]MCF7548433.1 VanZ family protein [Pseudonocardia sp. WMMC193]
MGRLSFALAVLVSLVVLFLPASGVPTAAPGVDKLVHLGVFALLGATGRWARIPPLPLVLGLSGYAVLSEVLQDVLPIGRDAEILDVVADCVGVSVGVAVHALVTRRR